MRMMQQIAACMAILFASVMTCPSAKASIVGGFGGGGGGGIGGLGGLLGVAGLAAGIAANDSDDSSFGNPDTQTYGQVFTAPITGTLESFTLYLDGGVGALHGGVGMWNGPASYAPGFGESVNLYTSPSTTSNAGGAYTFNPGINVLAGQRYVAYLSVFGEPLTNTTTSMPLLDTNPTELNYFVSNASSNPTNNPSWNYSVDVGDVQFSALFSDAAAVASVPEPTSLALFCTGTCVAGIGAARGRRCHKQQAAAG